MVCQILLWQDCFTYVGVVSTCHTDLRTRDLWMLNDSERQLPRGFECTLSWSWVHGLSTDFVHRRTSTVTQGRSFPSSGLPLLNPAITTPHSNDNTTPRYNNINFDQEFHTNMAKIDVHCHAVPPKYRQRLIENGHQAPDGMPAIPVCSIPLPEFVSSKMGCLFQNSDYSLTVLSHGQQNLTFPWWKPTTSVFQSWVSPHQARFSARASPKTPSKSHAKRTRNCLPYLLRTLTTSGSSLLYLFLLSKNL